MPTLKYPGIIYKYRSWNDENHKKLITKRQVYFSSPQNFTDPKDCNLPYNFNSITDNLIKQKLGIILDANAYPKKVKRGKRKREILKALKVSPLKTKKGLNDIIRHYRVEFYNKSGVLSLAGTYSNEEMWEQYADNHSGFCVGFNFDIISDYSYTGSTGPIKYHKKLPSMNPISLPGNSFNKRWIKEIYSKEKKWSFEDEYRLHNFKYEAVDDPSRSIQLTPEAFNVIYLGKNMNSFDKEELRSAVKKQIPAVSIIELP